MEQQANRHSTHSETSYTQPKHYTEYMTWYTPETSVNTQKVHEELGSRATELTVTTKSPTEEAAESTTEDDNVTSSGDSDRSTPPDAVDKESKLCETDEKTATYEELLDELRTARWIANAALIADRKGSPTSARVKQRRYQRNRKAMPSRFSGGIVATGFGSL